jgi:cell division protein FtsI/penicillin-binding protein 2
MAGMGTSRAWLAVAVTLVMTVTAVGCSQDSASSPNPTIDGLVHGLTTGDFSDVSFDGEGTTPEFVGRQYDKTVAGLGEVRPKVSVATTDRGANSRVTATLHWTWPIGSGWSYSTKAPLVSHDDGDTWKVSWSVEVIEPSLTAGDRLKATTLGATRGDILGAHGAALVTKRPVVRFGVDRLKVGPARAPVAARRLAELVGIDVEPYVKQVRSAGPKAFVEAIAFRKDEVPPAVTSRYVDIKGVDAIADQLPLGITKEFAAPILGTVGPVTAEIIKDNPGVYGVGDLAGLSGLEARYDEQLRGTPGVAVDAVDAAGTSHRLFTAQPVDGTPLHLTLDPRLQLLAEDILSDVRPASAIVAIKPSSGAILAAANGPGNNGYNDATYGRFAPGSTFKTVDSLALIKHGLRQSSPVDCPTRVDVDGKVFTNDSFYPPGANGRISLATALANSCNTAFINARTRLGRHDLVDAAATLGMGVDHDLGFPAYFGNVVPPTTETTKAADMIGQGQIVASPMAMATVMGSVVAGHTVVPQLITSVDPGATTAEPLTGAQDATLKHLLRGVVLTGTGVGLRDVPGAPVIAKTGTAEFDRDGKRLTHAWMIAGYGDLAVCAFVDVGQTGAGTAGPLLERFLRGASAR